jgi:hypothetical protein
LKSNERVSLISEETLSSVKNVVLDLSNGDLYNIPETKSSDVMERMHMMSMEEMRHSPFKVNRYSDTQNATETD